MLTCRRIVNRKFLFVSWPESISFDSLPSLDPLPRPPPSIPSLACSPCSLPSILLFSLLPCIAILGTVDFVLPDGKCFFRTCDKERDKVIFQMVCQDLPPPSLLAVSLNLLPSFLPSLATKARRSMGRRLGRRLAFGQWMKLFLIPGNFGCRQSSQNSKNGVR